MKILSILVFLSFVSACSTRKLQEQVVGYAPEKLVCQDNFESLENWVTETPVHPNSKVFVKDNKLTIDVAKGATVWFRQKLSGNYIIEYKRKVIVDGGANDRLSDMNQFWVATDPLNPKLFTRTGVFEEYDSLNLYYFGIGGNTNKTTRFRKYRGGTKPLLQEYLDKEHLLEPNKEYLITTVVKDGLSEVYVDGERYFSYQDQEPLREGYFGFRTTWSRHQIRDFKIYLLK